jgi:hypothetical protein
MLFEPSQVIEIAIGSNHVHDAFRIRACCKRGSDCPTDAVRCCCLKDSSFYQGRRDARHLSRKGIVRDVVRDGHGLCYMIPNRTQKLGAAAAWCRAQIVALAVFLGHVWWLGPRPVVGHLRAAISIAAAVVARLVCLVRVAPAYCRQRRRALGNRPRPTTATDCGPRGVDPDGRVLTSVPGLSSTARTTRPSRPAISSTTSGTLRRDSTVHT